MHMKRIVRSVVCVLLSTAMILPLAACNKKNSKNNKKRVKQEVVKEDDPYFAVSKTPLELPVDPELEVEYQSLYNMTLSGDIVMGNYTVNYKMPKEVLNQLENFDFEKEGACDEYEKISSKYYDSGVVWYDLSGKLIKKSEEDTTNAANIFPQKDGTFLKLVVEYLPGECKAMNKLYSCDKDGNELREINLDIQDVWDASIFQLDNGNILIDYSDKVCLYDKDGKKLNEETVENSFGSMYFFGDKYYVYQVEFNESTGEEKASFQEIDPDTGKKKGEPQPSKNQMWGLIQGMDGCYLGDDSGIVKIDPITGEEEMILDWNWTDFNSSNVSLESAMFRSKDEIILFETKYSDAMYMDTKEDIPELSLVTLTRQEKNPHAGKTVIELGTLDYVSSAFRDYIIAYNVDTTHQSRVIVRSYADDLDPAYAMENDQNKLTQMVSDLSDKVFLDMMSGDGSDILMNFSGFSQFNTEEVLVDLNTLIDGPNGFNRDEYFDNVFRAFEMKGKMYQIPVCIDINGYVSSSDIVGKRSGWTYEEFENVVKNLPKNMSVFEDGVGSSDLLESMLGVASDSFIDYEKKTVNFDTAEFRQLLEISKNYATNKPVNNGGGSYNGVVAETYSEPMMYDGDPGDTEDGPLDKINNGMLALTPTQVYSLTDIANVKKVLKGKEVFIGMPSPNGSGMSALPMMTLAIAESSSHKEEAWDFIRFMFSEDQQFAYSQSFFSIPINRAALDRKNAEEIKMIKEYNQQFEGVDPETSVDLSKFGRLSEVNEDDARELVALVENVSTISSIDTGIMVIINEEVQGYFENQRSAEDVCKIIQNKATTKVRER